MSAFRRAVLSVNPDRLEQFTNEMKKNISDKSSEKVSKRHRSPSESSSKRSKTRKRHSKSTKVVSKSSSQSAKVSESKEEKSTKWARKDSKKQHKSTSGSADKKAKEESDFDEKDLDLSNPLSSLTTLVKDRKILLDTAFSIVRGPKLKAMLPENLKLMPLDEVKQLCDEHLNVLSSKRIFHILSGTSMDSSSGTDSSDDERPANADRSKQQDAITQDHTLQTNLVDSTTTDSTGPSMLFPSALSTAQRSLPDDKDAMPLGSNAFGNSPTSSSPTATRIIEEHSSVRKPGAKDEDLEVPVLNAAEDGEIDDMADQVSEAKEPLANIDEVFVEEVEEIEETMEDQIHEDIQERELETDHSVEASTPEDKLDVYYSGKTQLEILELELRARAIRSLMKAAKASSLSLKTATSEK